MSTALKKAIRASLYGLVGGLIGLGISTAYTQFGST
jgi:hypothetical protein